MFSAKQLSPEQVKQLHTWAKEGKSMSDIQALLKEVWNISVTFMDTRFVILDLGIELLEEKAPEEKIEKKALIATGQVHTKMDTIMRAGALLSGSVEFSDGETAIWIIDEQGRPSIDPDSAGYQPTREDLLAFQSQLRALVKPPAEQV